MDLMRTHRFSGRGLSPMGERAAESDGILEHFVGGQGSRIGRFSADPLTGCWWWSDGVYEIFGYCAGEIEPSWDLIRSHIPDPDRTQMEEHFARARQEVGAFTWSHRIRAADGVLRSILVVGEKGTREGGRSERELAGYVVDLTCFRLGAARAAGTDAVQRSAEHRAVIEQAKGALMLAYHLDADAAFALLCWHSQRTNRKLHVVASTVMSGIVSDGLPSTSLRNAIDKLLAGPAGQPVGR